MSGAPLVNHVRGPAEFSKLFADSVEVKFHERLLVDVMVKVVIGNPHLHFRRSLPRSRGRTCA
jgi:hypothetical protein